jgi:hypothetical protein
MTTHNEDDLRDIAWPSRPALDDPMRQMFSTSLTELMFEQKISAIDLAGKVFGFNPKTHYANQAESIRSYVNGKSCPNPATAQKIAQVLGVPLSRLLNPVGPLIDRRSPKVKAHAKHKAAKQPKPPKATKAATTSKGSANIPAFMAVAHKPPPPPLPDGAPPLKFSFQDYAKDGRFAVVSITGTTDIDTATDIFVLIQRRK